MIKRLCVLLCLTMSAVSMMADEQVDIILSEEHPKQTTEYPGFCNIFVSMGETDDNDSTPVTIQIENLSESSSILLFDRAYSEKNLKEMSIVFHKNFPGNKGNRVIETSDNSSNLVLIEAGQKRFLPKLVVEKDKLSQCTLPLYIARSKEKKILSISIGKTKMEIVDKNVVELNIKVEVKDDEDLVKLNGEYEALVNELSTKTFIDCPKNSHAKSLKKQKAPYQERIDKLTEQLSSIIVTKGWLESDKKYKDCNDLKKKVEAIDLSKYEKKCEKKHPVTPAHNCNYCNMTLSQVLKSLERIYKQLDTRKITKEAALEEANGLYNACTNGKCPKLADRWKTGSSEKSSITNYYNRIKNF